MAKKVRRKKPARSKASDSAITDRKVRLYEELVRTADSVYDIGTSIRDLRRVVDDAIDKLDYAVEETEELEFAIAALQDATEGIEIVLGSIREGDS